MGTFKLAGISMKGLFSKPVTKMYPVLTPEYFENTAGHIENINMKDCILCGICVRKCPTSCLTVDKNAETWSIDPFSCIGCNSCVRACPKKCLEMQRSYTAPATEKKPIVVCKPELSEEEKAAKAAAEAEKAARIAAAKAAAAAKKAAAESSAE